LFKAALGLGKLIGLNESFGSNVSGRYGTISIPGSSNSVIKSPVDGVINNMKKISGCKNQITIESVEMGYFLQYCGVTKPRVRDGESVSEGQVIGSMDKNDIAEVLLLNRKKTGEMTQKRWAETGEKKQTDPFVIDAIKAPFKKVAKFFKKERNEEDEKLNENIEKIKRLLK